MEFPIVLTFSKCDKVQCKEVVIIDDTTVEKEESFGLILERLPGVNSFVEIDPNRTMITILDNDSKYSRLGAELH